jgi:hypothetical protein
LVFIWFVRIYILYDYSQNGVKIIAKRQEMIIVS